GRRRSRRAVYWARAPSLRRRDGPAVSHLSVVAAPDARGGALLGGLVPHRRRPWIRFLGFLSSQPNVSTNVRDHRGLAASYVALPYKSPTAEGRICGAPRKTKELHM